MYELIQVSEHDYYIDCPAKVGLVRINDTDVVAIDSGSDKSAAKKVLAAIRQNGWRLTAIYNTHSHADHIGGNRYLFDQTGCRIYAPGIEAAFTARTILEPAFLYGGYPLEELHHKFLMAQESLAQPLTDGVLPEGMTALPLGGHAFDMTGYRTADDTVFLADCLASEQTLSKYALTYLWNVEAYLETLARVSGMQASCFVPSHAAPTREIAPLAAYNIAAVHAVEERIVSLCEESLCFDELLKRLFDSYGLTMNTQQFALIGSTLRSYLSWLQKQGRLSYCFAENRMLWQCVKDGVANL